VSDKSKIEWTEATWNPVTGCTEVSEGCDHCYARTFAERFRGVPRHPYEQGFDLRLWPERLDQPLRWKRPRVVFVNSMSDLFHDDVPDEFIARVFLVMAQAQRHNFQVLTKRPGRMASILRRWTRSVTPIRELDDFILLGRWPLPNVWLGTSIETQKWANVRIPKLLETPAVIRFLSCEPLLAPLELPLPRAQAHDGVVRIHWVIVGGESGPGARPIDPQWARSLRDQCLDAGVPFFFKQWGGRTPRAGGRELDGRTWDEMPARQSSNSVSSSPVRAGIATSPYASSINVTARG
jgi:protein gp37